jgi:hypothetical protein
MNDRPPWLKPAISFGLPLAALVAALPYITGHPYGLPAASDLTRSFTDARQTVLHAFAGAAPSLAPAPAKVRFYECTTANGKVLSSSPCAPLARVRDIDPASVNHMKMDAPPSASPGTASPQSGKLHGVRADLAAAQSSDASSREAAEAAAN